MTDLHPELGECEPLLPRQRKSKATIPERRDQIANRARRGAVPNRRAQLDKAASCYRAGVVIASLTPAA